MIRLHPTDHELSEMCVLTVLAAEIRLGPRQVFTPATEDGVTYLHTGEFRHHWGPLPDVLAPIELAPSGRLTRGHEAPVDDNHTLYVERPVEALEAAC